MSVTSDQCEQQLRQLAEDLQAEADQLEMAADTLRVLRESRHHQEALKKARAWARTFLKKEAK
jgi:hypothetical protein